MAFGRGCWRCYGGRPVLALDRSSLCFNCLSDWFGGDEDKAATFLEQNLNHTLNAELLSVRKIAFEEAVAGWKARI